MTPESPEADRGALRCVTPTVVGLSSRDVGAVLSNTSKSFPSQRLAERAGGRGSESTPKSLVYWFVTMESGFKMFYLLSPRDLTGLYTSGKIRLHPLPLGPGIPGFGFGPPRPRARVVAMGRIGRVAQECAKWRRQRAATLQSSLSSI
jgi:hypothetical protein